MSFIRPEAAAWLRRLAEPALAGAAALWLGTYGAGLLQGGNIGGAVALVLALAAGAWAVAAGLRTALWARRGAGPGVVEVREGGIAYFGPEGGGVAALDALASVEVEDGTWVLTGLDGTAIEVPDGALGAQKMLDVLGTLPGFDTMAAVRAGRARVTVWRRASDAPRLPRERPGA